MKALWGANLLREHYFRWEEGYRHSFYAVESSGPLFKALAEDYLVEPRGEDACRFTWTIAVEPSAIGCAGSRRDRPGARPMAQPPDLAGEGVEGGATNRSTSRRGIAFRDPKRPR